VTVGMALRSASRCIIDMMVIDEIENC